MPGKKRINVHASYAFLGEDKGKVDRDKYEPTRRYAISYAVFCLKKN